ncbi:hypothetical protein HH214_14595 [Mucilaginibacter robiniae]|uniref:Uncharacterized protein n=1 Tax=Mucilaginibacter robiniae TaxID=2728022 RepID=A0A7L5E403_9SPHI|nr:hypothetical protein [Mucilaginibacter robiniae]QJD97009.1 hypothetical protein HH214_14595 [Mucilaginibacter robiniae]
MSFYKIGFLKKRLKCGKTFLHLKNTFTKFITVMKKTFLLLLTSFLYLPVAFAQQPSPLFMSLGKPLRTQKGVNMSGSAYLNNDFQTATVTTTSGKQLKNLQVRYDMLNQRVECNMDNNLYDITDSVSKFDILSGMENHTGKFIKVKNQDLKTPGFLELVYADKVSLYKLNSVKIASQEDFYTKKVTKSYVPSSTYFVTVDDTFKKVGSTKKDFQTAFKGNDRVKSVLNADDLDLKTDVSGVALGEAINGN